jgi:hypothetical protein
MCANVHVTYLPYVFACEMLKYGIYYSVISLTSVCHLVYLLTVMEPNNTISPPSVC